MVQGQGSVCGPGGDRAARGRTTRRAGLPCSSAGQGAHGHGGSPGGARAGHSPFWEGDGDGDDGSSGGVDNSSSSAESASAQRIVSSPLGREQVAAVSAEDPRVRAVGAWAPPREACGWLRRPGCGPGLPSRAAAALPPCRCSRAGLGRRASGRGGSRGSGRGRSWARSQEPGGEVRAGPACGELPQLLGSGRHSSQLSQALCSPSSLVAISVSLQVGLHPLSAAPSPPTRNT